MGEAIEDANPEVTMSLLSCVKSATASSSVQQAAVQAFRQMTLTDEVLTLLDNVSMHHFLLRNKQFKIKTNKLLLNIKYKEKIRHSGEKVHRRLGSLKMTLVLL